MEEVLRHHENLWQDLIQRSSQVEMKTILTMTSETKFNMLRRGSEERRFVKGTVKTYK